MPQNGTSPISACDNCCGVCCCCCDDETSGFGLNPVRVFLYPSGTALRTRMPTLSSEDWISVGTGGESVVAA